MLGNHSDTDNITFSMPADSRKVYCCCYVVLPMVVVVVMYYGFCDSVGTI